MGMNKKDRNQIDSFLDIHICVLHVYSKFLQEYDIVLVFFTYFYKGITLKVFISYAPTFTAFIYHFSTIILNFSQKQFSQYSIVP